MVAHIRMSEDTSEIFGWSSEVDNLLAAWCDNAKAFEWMHTEAYSYFDARSKQFMIAINCLTAVSGLSNVIAGGAIIGSFQLSWVFGGISIAVSTLNILQDKLGYQTSSQIHRKLASDWNSVKAKIEEVISIPYSGRKDCKTFMRYIKTDINKASMDGNSLIPERIRDECYTKFKDVPNFDMPDICGEISHTKVLQQRLLSPV